MNVPCKSCGVPIEVDDLLTRTASAYGVYCEVCMGWCTKAEVRKHDYRRPFSKYCPPCFEDTEYEQLPCKRLSVAAMLWCFGDRGLNLWGVPGSGKTRTMSLILRKMHDAGHSLVTMGPGGFRDGCQKHNWKRAPWLDKLSSVDLLFIDDMDKMNLTRDQEKDLFAVLTNRMGRKPVMLTGNSNGHTLESTYRLGEPMVRRIRDHCLSIHFDKADLKPVSLPL